MTRTILLADDSVTIQKVIELTFMDEDYEVVAVGNGDEALEKLDEITPDFVIADVHMPGASGYDVARHSKSLRPEVPVLLLVSTFEPFDEERAEKSGCDAFLKKPFDSQELQRLVEELSAEARGEGAAEASGIWSAPAEGEAPDTGRDEAAEEQTQAEPFSIGLDEDEEPPPTRVAPPAEAAAGAPGADPDPFGDAWPSPEASEPFELEPEELGGAELGGPYEPPAAPEAAAPPPPASEPEPEPEIRGPLSDEDVDRIARRVVELLGDRPVREVAWEVVPDLAEVVIRSRLEELEAQVESAG